MVIGLGAESNFSTLRERESLQINHIQALEAQMQCLTVVIQKKEEVERLRAIVRTNVEKNKSIQF